MTQSSINKSELEKFAKLADKWWDLQGPFKILHQINPVRLEYIKNQFGDGIKKKNLLDLGCGGGIVSFPLEKMGAQVTALDAAKENIESAKIEAANRKSKIDFICSPIENHKKSYSNYR